MKLAYYPGCTLKTTAKNFEFSAIEVLKFFNIEFEELPRWNCCGTVYSLASDDLIHKLAPIRILIRAKEIGADKLLTLCAMCYNTIKRANLFIKTDKESRDKLNEFMYEEETKYNGELEVIHLLELLRDTIGFANIKNKVRENKKLKIAPYYGCLLLRPKEIAIDDPENPTIFEDLLISLGLEVIDFPYKNECCGAYQTVNETSLVINRTYKIINCAKNMGADALVTSCPLCQFNLDNRQKEVKEKFKDFQPLPILYFTQIMGISLGIDTEKLYLNLNYIEPTPLLIK